MACDGLTAVAGGAAIRPNVLLNTRVLASTEARLNWLVNDRQSTVTNVVDVALQELQVPGLLVGSASTFFNFHATCSRNSRENELSRRASR
ncbi:hypothetical protein COO55_37970 [Rhodococcus opacus]|nr:hypothetical protein COO55_37970 [Rhodococcus opacus]